MNETTTQELVNFLVTLDEKESFSYERAKSIADYIVDLANEPSSKLDGNWSTDSLRLKYSNHTVSSNIKSVIIVTFNYNGKLLIITGEIMNHEDKPNTVYFLNALVRGYLNERPKVFKYKSFINL